MVSMQEIILFGGGGHAAVVAEAAKAAGFLMVGYLDDAEPAQPDSPIAGFKRLGKIADLPAVMKLHRHAYFHAAIGDAALRKKWLELPSPRPTPAIIHSSAVVSPSAKIAEGVFIGPNAVVNARANIGRGAIINTGAIIEHECEIGDAVHVAPGACVAGRARVGAFAFVGIGAQVIQCLSVGDGATVGAGAVVLEDVPDGATVVGVPARVVKVAPSSQPVLARA